MNSYLVKAIVGPTIQGEGPRAGWPAALLRLAGCNAWDGREETRAVSACPYCDTDFTGGEQMGLEAIGAGLTAARPPGGGCVLTGGEPLLQADAALLSALAAACPWVDLETNGTLPLPARPPGLTVVCSPKAIPNTELAVVPDVWKILIPHQRDFLERALASGRPVYVQPVRRPDDPRAYDEAMAACRELCLTRGVRLSLQLHKELGMA